MAAIQIITTTPTRELAEQIAARLVEERLAACVQIDGPIQSTYRWQGRVEQDQEWRVAAKTVEARFDQIENLIRSLHPYDVPEILAMPVVRGSESYLRWVEQESSGG
jgi:periplasmic divalent cation tolerance protein